MKKLMYLLIAALMVTFTACGGGETTVCHNTGVACVADHSCCLEPCALPLPTIAEEIEEDTVK